MELSNKIGIVSVIAGIAGVIVTIVGLPNKDLQKKYKQERNNSMILNHQVSYGEDSPNINKVNGNVYIRK